MKTSEEFKGSAHKHRKQKKSKDNDICDTKCKSKVKQNGDAIEEVDAHKIEKKRKRKRRDDNIEDGMCTEYCVCGIVFWNLLSLRLLHDQFISICNS